MPSRVLVLGASSRVGHHFITHLPGGWSAESAGRTPPRVTTGPTPRHTPLDLSDENAVRTFLRSCRADAWVNFAARTDVDGCERERPLGEPGPAGPAGSPLGSAWRINAELPRWLAEEAGSAGRFLVQISTDYIFDGTQGPYPEATPPSAFSPRVSWYGYTKGVGEAAVFRGQGPRAVLRIAHPYGTTRPGATDLALTLLQWRREGTTPPLYTDQRITPTWIPDVTEAVGAVLDRSSRKAPRIYHVASPEPTTPLEFARTLYALNGWREEDLRGTPMPEVPPPGRAPRPRDGGLLVTEIHRLDYRPVSFREGLRNLTEELRAREAVPSVGMAPVA